MRRAAKVDDNQAALVKELRKIGAVVAHTHTIGAGFPDLVVAYRGKNYLLEVKDPGKSASRKKLTADELKFHNTWPGPIFIVETLEGFLNQVQKYVYERDLI